MNFDGDLLIIMTSVTIMVIGLPLARAMARRLTARLDDPPAQLPADLGARLERIEQITEATQLEVERLAEGQRFTTRLLSERPPVREERPGR
jgi:hypothetical protein